MAPPSPDRRLAAATWLTCAVVLIAVGISQRSDAAAASAAEDRSLGVVTYNLHSGLGPALGLRQTRERVQANLRGIAATIAAADPTRGVDIVGLNEVDVDARRSAWIDQGAYVANELTRLTGDPYTLLRGETWRRRRWPLEATFGNALLVRNDVIRSDAIQLVARTCPTAFSRAMPPWFLRLPSETRGAIRASVSTPVGIVDAIVTHLDPLSRSVRAAQAACLVESLIEGSRSTILIGDLNGDLFAPPRGLRVGESDPALRVLTRAGLRSSRAVASRLSRPPDDYWATYPSHAPRRAIDWIMGSEDLHPTSVTVIDSGTSDHRGLYVRFVRR